HPRFGPPPTPSFRAGLALSYRPVRRRPGRAALFLARNDAVAALRARRVRERVPPPRFLTWPFTRHAPPTCSFAVNRSPQIVPGHICSLRDRNRIFTESVHDRPWTSSPETPSPL